MSSTPQDEQDLAQGIPGASREPPRPDLDALWNDLLADALASDGPIRDSDVKDAVKRARPKIEAAVAAPPEYTMACVGGHSHPVAAPPEPQQPIPESVLLRRGRAEADVAPPEPPRPDPAWKRLHAAAAKTFSEAREDSDLYDALKESHEALMRLSGADASALPLDVYSSDALVAELVKRNRARPDDGVARLLNGLSESEILEFVDAGAVTAEQAREYLRRLSPSSGESE